MTAAAKSHRPTATSAAEDRTIAVHKIGGGGRYRWTRNSREWCAAALAVPACAWIYLAGLAC